MKRRAYGSGSERVALHADWVVSALSMTHAHSVTRKEKNSWCMLNVRKVKAKRVVAVCGGGGGN